MDVIQQLKENCRPFGLMSKEMQKKMREIGIRRNFLFYGNSGDWPVGCGDVFHINSTYRLRPDYAEEPEIVECEIITDQGKMWYMQGCLGHKLH